MITIADIETARERLASRVRRTPVMALTECKDPPTVDGRISLKLESLQVTGWFKARGAMNPLPATPRAAITNGLVTASGGNHGLGSRGLQP